MDSKACHVNYFIIVYVKHLLNKTSLFQKNAVSLSCMGGFIAGKEEGEVILITVVVFTDL